MNLLYPRHRSRKVEEDHAAILGRLLRMMCLFSRCRLYNGSYSACTSGLRDDLVQRAPLASTYHLVDDVRPWAASITTVTSIAGAPNSPASWRPDMRPS